MNEEDALASLFILAALRARPAAPAQLVPALPNMSGDVRTNRGVVKEIYW